MDRPGGIPDSKVRLSAACSGDGCYANSWGLLKVKYVLRSMLGGDFVRAAASETSVMWANARKYGLKRVRVVKLLKKKRGRQYN